MKYSLGNSNFLVEISNLSHYVVLLYLFALIAEEGFVISLAIIWNSAFKWVYLSFLSLLFTSLLFTAICKASSDSRGWRFHDILQETGSKTIPKKKNCLTLKTLKWSTCPKHNISNSGSRSGGHKVPFTNHCLVVVKELA